MKSVPTVLVFMLLFGICCTSPVFAVEKGAAATTDPTGCGFVWGVAATSTAKAVQADKESGRLAVTGDRFSLYLQLNGCQQGYLFWYEDKGGLRILAAPDTATPSVAGWFPTAIPLPSAGGTLFLVASAQRQPRLEELARQATNAKGREQQARAVANLRQELQRLQRADSGMALTGQRPMLVAGAAKGFAGAVPNGAATVTGNRFVTRTIRFERR